MNLTVCACGALRKGSRECGIVSLLNLAHVATEFPFFMSMHHWCNTVHSAATLLLHSSAQKVNLLVPGTRCQYSRVEQCPLKCHDELCMLRMGEDRSWPITIPSSEVSATRSR